MELADFAEMMTATQTCVLIHDAETKSILWANPAACDLLEFPLEEIRHLKANHMSSSAQQYDRAIGRARLQEAVERGARRFEWHYRTKSGRVIPTDALAVRVTLSHGVAVMVQFRNIEHEQQIERELRRTTSYVDALARHTATMALVLDSAGSLLFATDSLLSRLNTSVDDEAGRLLDRFQLRRDGSEVSWPEVVARAAPVTGVQIEVAQPTGDKVWLEGSVERLRDQEDTFLLILHDTTDRVAHENRRSRALEQENYLARYNAMGDMAMAIAHELGQPLAAASNFLSGVRARVDAVALSGEVPGETTQLLSFGITNAGRQVSKAATIVNAVRTFVGHLEHVEQVVDLNQIVEECLWFIRLRAKPHWVEIVVDLHPDPVAVRCERVLTGQVILNLCFNAIEEMMECPRATRRVAIRTRRDSVTTSTAPGGVGVFLVDDQGRGLAVSPFEQSFTSKEGGNGIGLALSHRIITRQHGTIWAEAGAGGGTRFGFTLPLAGQIEA